MPKSPHQHRILSLKQVCERTSYSEDSVRRLSKKGILPPIIKIGPNRVGMLESALDEYLISRPSIAAVKSSPRGAHFKGAAR